MPYCTLLMGEEFRLEIEESPKKCRFILTDTGMGIEKEEIPRIFEGFTE